MRLPARTQRRELRAALDAAMCPYKIIEDPEDAPPEFKKYMVYEYCTERLKERWEENFYDVQNRFPSFEAYCDDYGHINPETGKGGGVWINPNSKWEGYGIGWMWCTRLPLRNGSKSHMTRIRNIDFDALERKTCRDLETFISKFRLWVGGRTEFPRWKSPHDTAVHLSLADCSGHSEFDRARWKNVPHLERPCSEIPECIDIICTELSDAELVHLKPNYFPLWTFGRLNENGWEDLGQTRSSFWGYVSGMESWFRSGDQRDWVIMLLCRS